MCLPMDDLNNTPLIPGLIVLLAVIVMPVLLTWLFAFIDSETELSSKETIIINKLPFADLTEYLAKPNCNLLNSDNILRARKLLNLDKPKLSILFNDNGMPNDQVFQKLPASFHYQANCLAHPIFSDLNKSFLQLVKVLTDLEQDDKTGDTDENIATLCRNLPVYWQLATSWYCLLKLSAVAMTFNPDLGTTTLTSLAKSNEMTSYNTVLAAFWSNQKMAKRILLDDDNLYIVQKLTNKIVALLPSILLFDENLNQHIGQYLTTHNQVNDLTLDMQINYQKRLRQIDQKLNK